MPLFGKKKTKVALEDFCEVFYREVVADATPMMVPGTTIPLSFIFFSYFFRGTCGTVATSNPSPQIILLLFLFYFQLTLH